MLHRPQIRAARPARLPPTSLLSLCFTVVTTPLSPAPSASPRRLVFVLGLLTALALIYLLRGVLIPLFLAFLLAYALDPLVDRLEAIKVPRSAGALLVMMFICGAGIAAVIVVVPYLIDEFRLAGDRLPEQMRALKERLDPFIWETFHVNLPLTWGELASKIAESARARMPDVISGSTGALFGTLNVVLICVAALIVPVFALYLLIDFDRIVQRFRGLIPRRWTPLVGSIAFEIHRALGGYVRGQLTACVVLAALYAGGLMLTGLRLAVPIGVITGMLAFVPYVGFGIGVSMAVIIALLDWHGFDHLAAVVAVMFLVQIVDGMAVTPRIVGRSVGLRPIEVLLTMMAAATLFGFLGVLLAVPLGAVVKILLARATSVYLGSDFYLRPPAPLEAAVPVTELAPVKTGSVPPSRTGR
jgi:predicted PurR-regulated permease PerM